MFIGPSDALFRPRYIGYSTENIHHSSLLYMQQYTSLIFIVYTAIYITHRYCIYSNIHYTTHIYCIYSNIHHSSLLYIQQSQWGASLAWEKELSKRNNNQEKNNNNVRDTWPLISYIYMRETTVKYPISRNQCNQ